MLAIAAQGDRAMIAQLNAVALQFGDRENLQFARALIAIGDPQGLRLLGTVQNSDDELLRLEAARVLASTSPQAAFQQLAGAVSHSNTWVRLRALELLRGLSAPPEVYAHLLVADDEWLRLRSAELVLTPAITGPTPRSARR
jgi:HEAT repeat protein